MSPCPDADLLDALADGALDRARADELHAHVHDCDVCRETVAALVRTGRPAGIPPARTPTQYSVNTQVGPYVIKGLVGRGGMGTVYCAADPRLGRDVALKFVPVEIAGDPRRSERFSREARAIARLNHPNILTVFDVGAHDGVPFVVTELLEGTTLQARLAEGRLPLRRAVEIGAEIAAGLAEAHDKGLVHRDLKPANVFLTDDGRVKILDFGLARYEPTHEDEERFTEPGLILGTVGYMAPEQLLGQPADARADLFGLGVVLFEMLAGRLPFGGGTDAELLAAVLRDEPAPLPDDVPPRVARLVLRCLEKDRRMRYQAARDLEIDLREVVLPASGEAELPALPRRARRHAFWALVVVALATIGAAVYLLRSPAPRSVLPYHQVTYDATAVSAARLFPDGQTFAYSTTNSGQPEALFVGRLDTTSATKLVDRAMVLAVSRTGQLAILHDVGYVADFVTQDGTLARMEVTGGGRRDLADHVTWADFRPITDELVYIRREQGRERIVIGDRVLYESEAQLGPMRWSPGGDRLLFGEGNIGTSRLKILDLEGGPPVQIGKPVVKMGGLAWSPDGRSILYGDTAARTIRRRSLDGEDTTLASSPDIIVLQDVAEDGRLLVTRFLSLRTIYVRAPGSVEDRRIGTFDDDAVSDLTDDGSKIAFASARGQTGGYRSFVQDTRAGAARLIGDGVFPRIAPNGNHVALLFSEHVWLAATGGGAPRPLAGSFDRIGGFAFTPDSKRVVFAASGRLYIQRLDGGDPEAVGPADTTFQITGSRVSPDGRWVTAVDDKDRVILVPLDGTAAVPVAGLRDAELMVGWAGDARHLYVSAMAPSTYVDIVDAFSGERRPFEPLARQLREQPAFRIHVSVDGTAWTYTTLRLVGTAYVIRP